MDGRTLGSPVTVLIANRDQRSSDYDHLAQVLRPSHADHTYLAKYGVRDPRGGGRASARETACRVAAGAFALMLLRQEGIAVSAYVSSVGHIHMSEEPSHVDPAAVEATPVRCPEPAASGQMIRLIEEVKAAGDSVGGTISCIISGCPAGLGEPVFDRLEADLARAMLSINATKGFEIGSGFAGSAMRGSAHNDPFVMQDGRITTTTNHSGGVQGGISNGMDIRFKVAFKPVATIAMEQQTVDANGQAHVLAAKGRHDACVVPRAVPIVEAMAALVLADHLLRQRMQGR
jgi:chorismate synthase